MTNKELADRLKSLPTGLGYQPLTEAIEELINELDPPRPEPGTAVWWRFYNPVPSRGWEYGVVGVSHNGIWTRDGLVRWERIEWKPAHVLGPDEVAVKIPPVSEWPDSADLIRSVYLMSNGEEWVKDLPKIITRAEAIRMEARDDA